MDKLEAISPIDGRYRRYTEQLADIFSEKGLIRYRMKVEGEYLLFLSEHPQIETREFSEKERSLIRRLYDVSTEDAGIVKAIEVFEEDPASQSELRLHEGRQAASVRRGPAF